MRPLALVLVLAGCSGPSSISPTTSALPPHEEYDLDASPKAQRRMVPPEVFLRSYLTWFGDRIPYEVFLEARADGLFDAWTDYLPALGLPDHHVDAPRATQSNTVMLATLGRLGEALCLRTAEHDLRRTTDRRVFDFAPLTDITRSEFAARFDVVHRTFLGFPADLAPAQRTDRFFALYRSVSSRPSTSRLSPDERGWAAVCTALIQHPEAGLY